MVRYKYEVLEYWIVEDHSPRLRMIKGNLQRSMTPSLQHSSWYDSTIHNSRFVLKQNAEQLSHQLLKRHHGE